MKIELQEKYVKILKKQFEEGLNILEKISVKNKHYQQIVVNMNNANNIAYQLELDIEKQKKDEMINAQAEADKILATIHADKPKRKYTKKSI